MKKLTSFLLIISAMTSMAQENLKFNSKPFDHIIDSLYKPEEPGGVALISQNGKVIYSRAFGMANMELGVKMQPDMVFEIGSMTKQFTAVCVLQLMEQAKLRLDDPISK